MIKFRDLPGDISSPVYFIGCGASGTAQVVWAAGVTGKVTLTGATYYPSTSVSRHASNYQSLTLTAGTVTAGSADTSGSGSFDALPFDIPGTPVVFAGSVPVKLTASPVGSGASLPPGVIVIRYRFV